MKAVVVRAFGPPESFQVEEIADPPVGPGEVRVRVRGAAVNFVDLLVASGAYQVKPELPFVPGGEFAGVVDAVGEGVSHLAAGDRVCGSGVGNAWGELATLNAALVFKIPDAMPFEEAAAFRVSNATVYHGLVQRAGLRAGETVLVLGAGGAIGYAAVQVAKALGARVIASASSEAKRSLALKAGADAVVETGAADWREQVKQAAGGRVDVVVDPVGGEMTEAAFRALGWNGRHLVIGFAGGGIPRLPTNLALVKGAALVGVDIRQFSLFEPETSAANMRALFELYETGRLPAAPASVFPLAQFRDAVVHAKDAVGRTVLSIGG
ncbi:MAG: zinc-binding alcohol dehydrogenase [Phenylobacterium sp.]|nr:zinc-binding alcohol dehydrogenase [Phenylobacterium sp.]